MDTASFRRALVPIAICVGLILAAVVLIAKTVSTTSARVSASTETDGFVTAGEIVLARSDDSASLLFDADNLYPGRRVHGCVELVYDGSVPAIVRLHGDPGSGTGLDTYLDISLAIRPDGACPAELSEPANDAPNGDLYRGLLNDLWSDHPDYATGLAVADAMTPGDRIAVEAVVVVQDDNRAAGLTTEFVFTFEARPA